MKKRIFALLMAVMLCGVLLSAASLAAENEALPTEEVQTEENTVSLDGGAELSLDGDSVSRDDYDANKPIWWDTTNGTSGLGKGNVTSVKLGARTITQANSNTEGGTHQDGTSVGLIYADKNAKAMLEIKVAEDYYVEQVKIACIHAASATAYKCGNPGQTVLNPVPADTVDGTYSTELDVIAFCHDSNNKGNVGYFILIKVAKATPTTGSLTLTKTVTGLPGSYTGKITYGFTGIGNNEVELEVAGNGSASTTITELTPGQYTITETTVADVEVDGVPYYCTSSVPSTVTVTAGGTATATVTNTYRAYTSAKVELEVSKTVTGTDAPTNELYTFELADYQTTTKTVQRTGAGTAKFELEFTNVGEYSFVVREVKGTNPRCTYDATEYGVTVTVTKSETTAGALEATTKVIKVIHEITDAGDLRNVVQKRVDGEGALPFTNSYKAYTPVTLTLPNVTKMLSGTDIPTDEEYTFVLKDEENKTLQTVKHTGRGEASFTAITYNTAGTYRYTVSEEKGTNPLCDYDSTVYTLNVEVTKDESTGSLKADYNVTKPQGKELVPVEGITFTNNYKDYTPATLTLPQIEKKLTGDAPAKAETYRFKLTAKDNAPMPEKDSVTVTGAGKVSFSEIKYTKAGTYVYEISEVAGTDRSCTYDKTVYTVTVTVTENMDGTLSAKSAITTGNKTASSILFTNSYPKAEKKAPSTGDSSRLGLWLGLALAGGCGCAAAVVLTKRREH